MDSKQLLDMNTIIQQIYDTDNKLFWQITHHYAKQLNNEEKQELIYYSIYKAINRYGLLEDDHMKNLICKVLKNECLQILRYNTNHDIEYIPINDIIPPLILDKEYSTVEMIEWLEEIKDILTIHEYKYLHLLFTEPNILEISITDIAKQLGISRRYFYAMRKGLKDKLLKLYKENEGAY